MPRVVSTACPFGVTSPTDRFQSTREITDDLPSDVIGECITEAVQAAWKAGFDPALDPFIVLVTFR